MYPDSGICYEAAVNIRDYSEKQLAGSMWGVLLFLMYIGNSLGDKDIDFRSIYLSGIFIVNICTFSFFFIKKWKQYTSYFLVAIFAVAIVEVTMNTEKPATAQRYVQHISRIMTESTL